MFSSYTYLQVQQSFHREVFPQTTNRQLDHMDDPQALQELHIPVFLQYILQISNTTNRLSCSIIIRG